MGITVGNTKSGGKTAFAHDVDASSTVLVVGIVYWESGSNSISAVSWTKDGEGAQGLTAGPVHAEGESAGGWVSLWYLLSPNVGSGDIAVTTSAGTMDEGPASYAINLIGADGLADDAAGVEDSCGSENCKAEPDTSGWTLAATDMVVGVAYDYGSDMDHTWDELDEVGSNTETGDIDPCGVSIATKINETDVDCTADYCSTVAMGFKAAAAGGPGAVTKFMHMQRMARI